MHVQTPGGGGYGDGFQRDPELVLRDVRMGYYSLEQAQQLFGVVIKGDAVDAAATADCRAEP